jgi:hypothetical protein
MTLVSFWKGQWFFSLPPCWDYFWDVTFLFSGYWGF